MIEFKNVTKRYTIQEDKTFKEVFMSALQRKPLSVKHTVFSNLNFTILDGETVGIIGKNGAGKSTLLKLIAGVTYPTFGQVHIHGKVAPLIELGAGFHHELSGYENIFLNAAILGMHKKEIELVVDKIIEFSGIAEFIHTPVKRYSSGMYMRLGFAIAIHTNAPILLIDEVLAVGDIQFQRKCLDYLKEMKKDKSKTIVFVSHDEKAIKSFCDRAILLEDGKIVADQDPASVIHTYHDMFKNS